MRVLKHGILFSGRKYTIDCRECGCRYVAKIKDATSASSRDNGFSLLFRCPECGAYTTEMTYNNDSKDTLNRHYDGAL